jgi:hypothetical protein
MKLLINFIVGIIIMFIGIIWIIGAFWLYYHNLPFVLGQVVIPFLIVLSGFFIIEKALNDFKKEEIE